MKKLASVCAIILVLSTLVYPQRSTAFFGGGFSGIVFDPKNLSESVVGNSLLNALVIKETTLDGIAYGITRTIIQSMVASIVTWINSGFQGSPAFVTDLQGHLQNIADQVVSDTLMNSELSFLCSPFELDVKVAIATEYNRARNSSLGSFDPQCTLDDVTDNIEGFLQGSFQEGGWDAWLELTQGEANDPNAAYLNAQVAVDAAIRNAQGEEIKLLEFGDGFLSFKVCSDTQVQSGAQQNCTITTPGRVIADQLNSALGAGRDQLITADEVNEVIGALLAQLAQQALTGINGLLGLGGNSSYSNNNFGSDGTSSYLDALTNEQVNTTGTSTGNELTATAFENALNGINQNLDAQYEIAARVDSAENTYNQRISTLTQKNCRIPDWPQSLSNARADATFEINRLQNVLLVIEELRTRLLTASTPQEQNDIMQQYLRLERDGALPSTIDTTAVEYFIEFDLKDDIDDLIQRLNQAENRCNDD